MERVEKQTAIEWLVTRIAHGGLVGKKQFDELVKQAKAMEKQQIIDSFGVGCQVESTRLIGYQDIAEQYYNETFKTE